jgi:hypothetical protein
VTPTGCMNAVQGTLAEMSAADAAKLRVSSSTGGQAGEQRLLMDLSDRLKQRWVRSGSRLRAAHQCDLAIRKLRDRRSGSKARRTESTMVPR